RHAVWIRNGFIECWKRLCHPREAKLAVTPDERYWRGTDAKAEHKPIEIGTDHPRSREREGAADRRMSRHGELLRRREYAHSQRRIRPLRRQDERRLREAHFFRNRLHGLGTETPAVQKHSQLIAAEDMVGEDIEVKVPVGAHHSGFGIRDLGFAEINLCPSR